MADKRRNPWGLILVGLCVTAGVAGLGWWLNAEPEPVVLVPADGAVVALGKKIYDRDCASCHGANLEGQPNWRERNKNGRLPAPPHDESGHTWHHADQQLFALTKFGVAAFVEAGSQSDMPAYQDKLGDQEIIAVLSFIKSTWPAAIRRRHDQMTARRK